MFEEILNSKKLSQAAAIFLSLPHRSFPIAEVATFLRVHPGTASHVLSRLQQNGLMRSFSKHGKKYYFFNARKELPPWAKNKILKFRRPIEDKLTESVKKLLPKAAFLSGVFAGYANLPVDILLVGRIDLKKLDAFLRKWQGIMGVELNYSVMSAKEFLSRRDTFDKFIKDIFDHRHMVVVDKVGKK